MADRPVLDPKSERLPLRGVALWRWKLALRIYRIGCAVSGRHERLFLRDDAWKVDYCPHCGEVKDGS